jgi:hypothetical protein
LRRAAAHPLLALNELENLDKEVIEQIWETYKHMQNAPPEIRTDGGSFGALPNPEKYAKLLTARQKKRQTEDNPICASCCRDAIDPQRSNCTHVFCKECIQWLYDQSAARRSRQVKCPACDANIWRYDRTGVTSPEETSATYPEPLFPNWFDLAGPVMPSVKTLAIKAQILQWTAEDRRCKIIIFTHFLDT